MKKIDPINQPHSLEIALSKLPKSEPKKPTFKQYLQFGLSKTQYDSLISDDRFLSLDETKELMSIYASYKKFVGEPFNM